MMSKIKKLSTRRVLLIQLGITSLTMIIALVVLGILAHPYFNHCPRKTKSGVAYFCNTGQVMAWVFGFIFFILIFIFAVAYLIYRELDREDKEKRATLNDLKQRHFKTKRDKNFYIELLPKQSETFQSIRKLVLKTWVANEDDVSNNSRDGINLYHNRIHIKQIYEITNKKLLDGFKKVLKDDNHKMSECTYSESMNGNHYEEITMPMDEIRVSQNPSPDKTHSEQMNPSNTNMTNGATLNNDLIGDVENARSEYKQNPDILMFDSTDSYEEPPSSDFCKRNRSLLFPNGCPSSQAYLFHGSLPEEVTNIIQNGFNPAREPPGPFGLVVNLYESSEKADQLSDKKFFREDSDLIMILVRTSPGRVYENKESPILKVPCDVKGCESQDCNHTLQYDSAVIGYANSYKHVLVYDSARCYPHYVIVYDRIYERPTISTHL